METFLETLLVVPEIRAHVCADHDVCCVRSYDFLPLLTCLVWDHGGSRHRLVKVLLKRVALKLRIALDQFNLRECIVLAHAHGLGLTLKFRVVLRCLLVIAS